MASPTPNRGMTYPAHGGAVGAWDTPLNADFDNIDLAFNTYPITILSSAVGATYNSSGAILSSTVATANLPSSLALNFHFPVTGTLTQNLTVVWSSVGGFYDVSNASSGAFSLTATVNGSTTGGIILPQGGRSFIVSDGTNGANGMYFGNSAFSDITVNSVTSLSTATALDFKATGTGANIVPIGSAAQRPTAAAGLQRYNSDVSAAEVSDANYFRYICVTQPIAAGFKNLQITNTTAASPTTQFVFTADAVTVESTTPLAFRSSAISMTISSSINGAGGLDVGGLANTTWYSLWLIYSSTGNVYNGLMSTSFTAPTMPAGYNCKARLGSGITNGSAHFQQTLQNGRSAQYVVTTGSTTALLPNMANGAAGTYSITAPTWAAISTVNFVPPTAAQITVVITPKWKNASGIQMQVAPNNSYSGIGDANGNIPPFDNNSGSSIFNAALSMILESTNIYWTSGGVGGAISCFGWEDNI